MAQDRNNCLGTPHKAGISYFRDWTVAGVGGGNTFVYGIGDPATSTLVGQAISVKSSDATNGSQIQVNEPGQYYAKLGIRINTNAGALFYIVRYNPAYGTTVGNYPSTPDVVGCLTASATGARYECSGIIDMRPGQFFMVLTNVANAVGECYFSVSKLATNSL